MDIDERRRIEAACRDLIVRLVHHYDHKEAAAAADLFTPDGVWVKSRVAYKGRDAIIGSFEAGPPDLVMRHFTSNIRIVAEDENNASGVTYYLAFIGRGDGIAQLEMPGSLGEWYDRFVRTENGWRFSSREGRRIFER